MPHGDRATSVEWLRSMESDPEALTRLCAEQGLARAAFLIARARCGTADAPTVRIVRAVARELAVRVGYYDAMPTESRLANECAQWGLTLRAA